MSNPSKVLLNAILVGDELGQVKLIVFDDKSNESPDQFTQSRKQLDKRLLQNTLPVTEYLTQPRKHHFINHKIIKIADDELQSEPAASRAILSIRPIHGINDSHIDNTDKPNHLFLIANKVGQVFVCNTCAIRSLFENIDDVESKLFHGQSIKDIDNEDALSSPMLSPIYYNSNNKVPVAGAQPVNQTNILIIYKNGDLQHVDISQNVLQSSLKFKKKAIRVLGLGYNTDAKAINWRVDGSTGVVYYDYRASHVDENDPLTDRFTSPSHKFKKKDDKWHDFNISPCKASQKCNKTDRLVPAQVINMVMSHDNCNRSARVCKWSSVTSLNLIYKKLALYDLIGTEDIEEKKQLPDFELNCFRMNATRLAVAGRKYGLRIYDIQTQKSIYNCRYGSKKNPLVCPKRGELETVGDLEWLGGNKTTQTIPNMIGLCTGIDATVKVFDIRSSSKPVFNIDLTNETETRWQPYVGHARGCQFTSISMSGAPYSTAVPSQQVAVGSKDGKLHVLDLRFPSKSYRTIGRLNGFCGGEVRQIRFVSESYDTTRMVSCASDRFVRVHRFYTSFTSVISQKLTSRIFLGTRPLCIQPVCDEQSYLTGLHSKYSIESHMSDPDSFWSL